MIREGDSSLMDVPVVAAVAPPRLGHFRADLLRVMVVEPQGAAGIWHYACAFSHALAGVGVGVTIATLSPVEPVGAELGVPVRIIGTRAPRRWWPPAVFAKRVMNHAARLAGLLAAVQEYRPDVVHIQDPVSKLDFLYNKLLRSSQGSKIVYTAHEVYWEKRVGWFDLARYRGADAILVHSRNAVEDLARGGVDRARIFRIPHGNYLHLCHDRGLDREEARRLLGLPASSRVLLFFGAVSPYKGLDLLIEAFSRIAQRDGDAHLVVAGRPQGDISPYLRRIDSLKVGSRILTDLRYIPFEEFAKFFVACDVVVLPYRRIYQSGILQLAYGFGRPVVVTNVGGIAEAVQDDRTGVVAPSLGPEGIATAISAILADPEAGAAMGRRGRELAETKYSWDGIARNVVQLYASLWAGHPVSQ